MERRRPARALTIALVVVCAAGLVGAAAVLLRPLAQERDAGSEVTWAAPSDSAYGDVEKKILSTVKPAEAARRIVEALRLGAAGTNPSGARAAIAELRAVARDYPGTLAAAKALGHASIKYHALGDGDEAMATALEATQACPPDSEHLVNLWWWVAALHQQRGEPDRGIAAFDEFVRKAEERGYRHADVARANLVFMHQEFGKPSKAIQEYEVFGRKYPNASREARATALQGLVRSLYALDRKEEALRHAREWAKWAKGTSEEGMAERAVPSLEHELGIESH